MNTHTHDSLAQVCCVSVYTITHYCSCIKNLNRFTSLCKRTFLYIYSSSKMILCLMHRYYFRYHYVPVCLIKCV